MKKSLKTMLALCATAVLSVSCALAITACGGTADHYDAITKTLKLTKSFEGKVLESSDGIEEVTLPGSTTDGDTTTFKYVVSEGTVRVRYQGVNTPESTGAVEKWGKAASIFTDTQLKSATKIVLESARDGAPEKDTVGGRSLCYVWYKTAEDDDFKCLNLELVENGYSINKEDAEKPYYSYFQKAETFAKEKKLRLHNPTLVDPLFDTSVQSISLKDFKENPDNYAENMKVHLHAYVVEKMSKSGVTYTIAQYDEETNQVYTLTMYAGHVSADGQLLVGGLYHIVGTLQKFNNNWQIAGIGYDNDYKETQGEKSEHSWRVQSSYYLTFNTSDPYYSSAYGTLNTYGSVTVGEVTKNGTALTFKGTATNKDGTTTNTFTFNAEVPEDYTLTEGATISILGCYRFTEGSDELTIVNYTDIVK